jgi:phosphoglycerol transferase MdoB-like AlkP superfamily enzyme|tara:strand:- start:2138 stop:2512 length:375 start_codon:yes stop_codon:yes gene_type:complete
MATMFRDLAIALVVAILLLAIGLALEVVPVGIEPIETPWRATVVMLIGLLIGVSGGFGWLQHSHIGTSFGWRVFLGTFTSAGFCALQVLYCLENEFETFYTLPIVLSGPISIGIVLGATVRSTK